MSDAALRSVRSIGLAELADACSSIVQQGEMPEAGPIVVLGLRQGGQELFARSHTNRW